MTFYEQFSYFSIFFCACSCPCDSLIKLSDDIEVNPALKNNYNESLSIYHWNLNSICAHEYSKVFLLKAYNSVQKFDIICFSETSLDSAVPHDDDNLVIPWYSLVHSDHLSNTKRGSVCLYKNYLPARVLNIGYLKVCLNFELMIGNKYCNFVVVYKSSSQSEDEFEIFADNFEMAYETLTQKGCF